MKAEIKNYLTLTKKEWNGVAGLLVLIVIVNLIPYGWAYFNKPQPADFAKLDSIAKLLPQSNAETPITSDSNAWLFKFNPNKLNAAEWQKLGLNSHQIEVIKHYEAKGGRFRSKDDVKKMYAISAEEYQQLEPYINLPGADNAARVIELNSADSAALTTLKGIGPGYAMRIIRYRDKLGGFHAKGQLKEVFGIDEEHYLLISKNIKVNSRAIRKLNINKATFEDLRRYPYLSYKQINAVIQYRNEHGDYESFDDLKEVAILDGATLKKVKPYWVFK